MLMALWEAMGRPTYSPRNWGSGVHLAKWFGVRVDSQGRVVELDLSQGRPKATHLPAELGQLDQLRVLDLSTMIVEDPTAQLPPEWGNLVNLRVLKTPKVSPFGGQGIGPIPPSWGNLVNLRHVDLSRYSVTHIPETLRAWTQVETLYVGANHKDKEKIVLPDIFDDWRALKDIRTGDLLIDEPFPWSLGQVSTLEFLYISWTSGQLPPGWGSGLTNIRSLRLFGQSGPLPAEWSNWSQVQEIHIGPVTGELPPEWGRLNTLEYLRLHGWPDQGKGLTGPLPPEWAGMTSLKTLIMVNQEFTGPLPPEWGALTHLEKVELQGNLLTGPLPPEWGALTHLKELNLSYNLIDGPLPSEWGGMTAMEKMACGDLRVDRAAACYVGQLASVEGTEAGTQCPVRHHSRHLGRHGFTGDVVPGQQPYRTLSAIVGPGGEYVALLGPEGQRTHRLRPVIVAQHSRLAPPGESILGGSRWGYILRLCEQSRCVP